MLVVLCVLTFPTIELRDKAFDTVKRSNLLRRIAFDRTHVDSDVKEIRRQLAEWADQEIEANSRFKANRSLTTDGCMVYFFFASIALALFQLLQLSAPCNKVDNPDCPAAEKMHAFVLGIGKEGRIESRASVATQH